MKYIVKCKLTDESIKNLKYFEYQNTKNNKNLKNKTSLYIPILEFSCSNLSKIRPLILSKFENLQIFRILISSVNIDENKIIYLLIQQLGFISMINRIITEILNDNDIQPNIITKWDNFYIEYLSSNKLPIHVNEITFPSYLKISSIYIFKVNSKKNTIVDFIKLKNI